ncbi:sensor histidine kinase [Nocardia alni]|uniref:sensor histidine kinase n=1 Tax=Nocardia alni TaxID=2815723 RepID=UPI001C23EB65|nr:histidine kinase [Nocardia alni]
MLVSVRQAARASMHLANAIALCFAMYLFISMILLAVAGTVTVIGIGILPETVLLLRRITSSKRRMTTKWTGRPIPEAYLPLDPPLRAAFRNAVRDPCTYADLRWLLAYYLYGALAVLAIPLWPVGLVVDGIGCGMLRRPAVVLPLISRLADLDARLSRTLLAPPPRARLTERVEQLTTTRAGAIAAHGAELRRIERDLHDGAQARLVALSMRIGLAKRACATDPQGALALLDQAQDQAQQALAELRHVVRTIHPPILTDRGLLGAVRALAADSTVATTVDTDGVHEGSRAPAAVEAAAYFVVAEALTNAAKHGHGDRAEVTLARTAAGLHVTVRDNGCGGAEFGEPTADRSGLLGMQRRVAALDGTFTLTSPAGGPTTIEAELPCVW